MKRILLQMWGVYDRTVIRSILCVPLVDNLERYLGLSCIVGRDKKRASVNLKDKIRNRVGL